MSLHRFILIPTIIIVFIFSSCEKTLFEPPLESNHKTVFDYTWQYTKDHYCGLHLTNVDWDSVYQIYAPQVDNNMDELAFANLLKDMFDTFKDTSIKIEGSSFGSFHYDDYAQYPVNLDSATVARYKPHYGAYYDIYNDVAYFNRFYVYHSNTPVGHIRDVYKDTAVKGFILDLRSQSEENHGELVNFLANRFTDTSILAGKKKLKIGSGADDFRNNDLHIQGHCETNCEKPIVVLTNRRTYGKGHELAYLLSLLPNTTLVGDSTGGGNSEKQRITILPNGWALRVPVECIVDTEGKSIVIGMNPDIFIDDDPATTDKDEIIEKALELLN